LHIGSDIHWPVPALLGHLKRGSGNVLLAKSRLVRHRKGASVVQRDAIPTPTEGLPG
jgi:hypothetical protein